MLCLSGFELYSRWVPLTEETHGNIESIPFCLTMCGKEITTNLPHTALLLGNLASLGIFQRGSQTQSFRLLLVDIFGETMAIVA